MKNKIENINFFVGLVFWLNFGDSLTIFLQVQELVISIKTI